METVQRKLDWKPNHDPKSRQFRAMGVPSLKRSRSWSLRNPVLDQGSEGACVGHGVINACSAARMKIHLPAPQTTAFGMYYGSRYIDERPGESYEGTSVNAGCQLAVTMGFASGYRWCFGAEEVAQTILEKSPVIIGIYWTDAMYETLPNGKVVDGGNIVGGHCICVTGFWRSHPIFGEPMFKWRQTWGKSYGLNGDGYVPYGVMDRALQNEGEAAILDPIP